MNPRTTGILLIVAAALGAFVWFYEIQGEAGRQEAATREKRLFPEASAESVEWVALRTRDGRDARIERVPGGWRLSEPLAFPADDFAADGIAQALVELQSEAVYAEPQAPEVYGLGDDAARVRFAAGGREYALRTGAKTPMGGNTYVALEGEKPVYTVAGHRVAALGKDLSELRDKRVLRFDADSVRAFAASWPGGSVRLERREDDWRIVAPIEAPADPDTVQDLLSDLSFLRATGFEDEPRPDVETGLDAPAFRIELEIAPESEGAEARRIAFALGAREDAGSRFAKATEATLYRVPANRIDDLPRELAAYRFKRLARFSAADARRVVMGFASPEGASVTITAVKQGDAWSSAPEAMAPEKIEALVDSLAQLEAVDVVAESVGGPERAALGLDPPQATFVVFGRPAVDAIEERDEDAPDVQLAEVRIGVTRGSDGIVAQSGERPEVFALDLSLAEHLPVSLDAFRNRFLAPEPAEAPAAEGESGAQDLPQAAEPGAPAPDDPDDGAEAHRLR